MMTFDEALDCAGALQSRIYDLWRNARSNRFDVLNADADFIESRAAALVAYLRGQAEEAKEEP